MGWGKVLGTLFYSVYRDGEKSGKGGGCLLLLLMIGFVVLIHEINGLFSHDTSGFILVVLIAIAIMMVFWLIISEAKTRVHEEMNYKERLNESQNELERKELKKEEINKVIKHVLIFSSIIAASVLLFIWQPGLIIIVGLIGLLLL